MKRTGLLLFFALLIPNLSYGWWNEDWGFKKKITLDTQKLKQGNIALPEDDAFALLRLHTGNFVSFMELAEKGKDIRVLAGDEKTPLKFYLEKVDPVNEMAFIWVKLTKEVLASPEPTVWLYFGNTNAVDGQDLTGVFNTSQMLSYHFSGKNVKDSTANANDPSESTNIFTEGGLIADAAQFQGSQIIRIPAAPSLLMSPMTGWTLSTWLKIDQAQTDAVIFQQIGSVSNFTLGMKDLSLVLQVTDSSDSKQEFTSPTPITTGTWHQLSVSVTADNVNLYIDSVAAGTFPVKLANLDGVITLGGDASGTKGFTGLLDQFALFKVARDANAVKWDFAMQGPSADLLTYGDDQTPDSEESDSYFMATLNNVTIDGWVIIGILGVMFLISWVVMVVKTIVVNRILRENKKFEEAFRKLDSQEISNLNSENGQDQKEYEDSPLLFSLTSHENTFSGSSLYRIYHVGVAEMNKRLANGNSSAGILSAKSLTAVKASMDAVLIRELQKLNGQMVLLTIAISGGPFLGLLGTVVGVMITFAAIAVNGEVNVNSIAPGIAAALTATVAGLAVAIPALFGYNYLGSRIKVVAADMQVFVDEFIAKLAEQHT